MKLSVSAFRAQASAQRKILSSYQNQLNYGTCTSFSALGRYSPDGKPQMMVDSTGLSPTSSSKPNAGAEYGEGRLSTSQQTRKEEKLEKQAAVPLPTPGRQEGTPALEKSPGRTRSRSNQRWMKLRTTVQLSGAISGTSQKSKPPLKREDSFLKRFSTRQIPETQETVDTGDETETLNGSQTQNEVNRRRRKRRKEMSKTVVNPDENFYFYWLMTVTICVLYNLWTLIVRQSFPELQAVGSAFWYSGDGFADIVFACDIVVQFRTGYLEQGLMVYDSKKLATHYLKSRAFALDILSLLPLDFLQMNVGINPMLRFPRFFKIYRVYTYYYMVESRTVYPNLWRVVNLIHILLILAHWFGCFYYLLSEAEGFQGDWVYPHRPGDYATLTRKYLGSLYWSTLTLTTIGDLPTPETNAESRSRSKAMTASGQSEGIPRRGHKSRLLQFNSNYWYLFTIISYLIGVFIFATIVGQVGNVITNRNANRLEFERLLDGAKTYMRHHKVPGGMKRRVLRWYDYSWSRGRIQGGGDINTALGLLPDKLKTELALHVNLSVLKKVTIFQECQPEFLHDLVLKMKAYIFTPGDLICRKGEVAREMFIIADGILDVISETGRVLTTMKAGDFFGEIGILNLDGLNKRTADVRSVGYSELFSLSREDVLTAMKDYPEAQEILQSLGRKRLMEAKNASKVYRAQAKQSKDHDSSGESDTAGKRIVEKLRSDVKGLKNALRRSRRGTRSKETLEAAEEGSGGKTYPKKHSILRRMSHVQSSDEYEANNDDPSPIGVGLPLLQRLKLLKEKQEREREEKESSKFNTSGGSRTKTDETFPTEAMGISLPFTQKLKLLKQKELKDVVSHGTSTVRTQASGVRFDKSTHEAKNIGLTGDSEKQDVGTRTHNDKNDDAAHKKKDFVECGRTSPKERPKGFGPVKERSLTSNAFQIAETAENSSCSSKTQFETSTNTLRAKEVTKAVPKSVGNVTEVPKSKDAWKLLKKSSISPSKSRTKSEIGENILNKGVSKKGAYISKSDTILEKQKSVETEEKRSGLASPPNGPGSRKMALRSTDENLTEGQGSRYGSTEPPGREDKSGVANSGDLRMAIPTRRATDEKAVGENKKEMRKYNSISDLSPEYSGLPFVKKLKILNERQKLEELEKELLVRSVSLDVPDRRAAERSGLLVRSQSEAATIDERVDVPNLRSESEETRKKETEDERLESRSGPRPEFRDVTRDEREIRSEGSIASPESNETLERRNLKSILKKLSAEDGADDDDRNTRNFGRNSTSGRRDNSEMNKLIRAPTVEGYAARHKKFTKSVTFDGDTPPSPADAVPGRPPDESLGQGLLPAKSTAILTLQLSNLSMVPIASPRKEGRKHEKATLSESSGIENYADGGGSEERKSAEQDCWIGDGKHSFSVPCSSSVQDLCEENFGMSPPVKRSEDDFFSDFKGGLLLVLQELLEEVESNFQSRFDSLRNEVKRRDEIILELQTKIWKLEVKNVEEVPRNSEAETVGRVAEVGGADPGPPEILRHVGSVRIGAPEEELEFPYDSAVPPPSSGSQSPASRAARKSLKSDVLRQAGNSFQGGVCSSSVCPADDSASPGRSSARAENNIPLCRNEFRSGLKPPRFLDCYPDDAINSEKKSFLLWKYAARSQSRGGRDEELELSELLRCVGTNDVARKSQGTGFRSRRNFGVDERHLEAVPKFERARNGKKEVESRPKKSFINRMTSFQRTFSCSQDKNSDFIALDIDESSNSSDVENNDWEVQMLVEELAKKDPDWEAEAEGEDEEEEEEEEEEAVWTSKVDAEHSADVKQLQQELNTLKQVVRANDLTRLTGSELDILGTVIEAKDQKITQIIKSSSLTDEDKNLGQIRQTRICAALSDNGISEPRKKFSLRQKIGRALSFDFQDVENTKPTSSFAAKRGAFLGRRSAFSCYLRQRRSATDLRDVSGQHTNGALECSHRINENVIVGGSSKVTAGSSLPILAASFLFQEKNHDPRTSLPFLCPRRFRPDSAEWSPAAVGPEEPHQEGGGERNNEEPKPPFDCISRKETGIFGSPTSGGSARPRECHPGKSLNSFIKSVGQKVKQVMIGDVNSSRNHVPTISKLCDEQTSLNDAEVDVSEDPREAAPERDVGSAEGEATEILNFIDRDSKVEHSDS